MDLLAYLRPVFQNGYRPARGNENYAVEANGKKVFQLANCLGHVLNLRNDQLINSPLSPLRAFCNFPNLNFRNVKYAAESMEQFFYSLGLSVQKCAPDATVPDFKSWKCALYFGDDPEFYETDYHFLLEDTPGVWSSKIGFSPYLEHIYTKEPPKVYAPITNPDYQYDLFATYQLTNPHADLNHPAVRGLENRLIINPEQKKLQHCIVQNGEKILS